MAEAAFTAEVVDSARQLHARLWRLLFNYLRQGSVTRLLSQGAASAVAFDEVERLAGQVQDFVIVALRLRDDTPRTIEAALRAYGAAYRRLNRALVGLTPSAAAPLSTALLALVRGTPSSQEPVIVSRPEAVPTDSPVAALVGPISQLYNAVRALEVQLAPLQRRLGVIARRSGLGGGAVSLGGRLRAFTFNLLFMATTFRDSAFAQSQNTAYANADQLIDQVASEMFKAVLDVLRERAANDPDSDLQTVVFDVIGGFRGLVPPRRREPLDPSNASRR